MGLIDVGYANFSPIPLIDQVVYGLNALFFDGRFRSLFCILFGIGLYLQSESFKARQIDHLSLLKSRLKWLWVFGLIHCVFIWPGDILMYYAMTGFLLLKRLDLPFEQLLRKGGQYIVIGFVMMTAFNLLSSFGMEDSARDSEYFKEAYASLTGSYTDILLYNLIYAAAVLLIYPFVWLFYSLGLVMLGVGLYKSGRLSEGFKPNEVNILLMITVVVAGIDTILATMAQPIWQKIPMLLGSISGVSMALLIWHLVLKSNVASMQNMLVIAIKRVGTMALTFYLLQSLIVKSLFRFAFPEWVLTFRLVDYMLLSCSLMVVQLTLGYVYKSYFEQGPMERLWRRLVERRMFALQRASAEEVS